MNWFFFMFWIGKKELNFNFGEEPQRFTDVETGEKIDLYADNVKDSYKKTVDEYFADAQIEMRAVRN